MSTTRDIMLGAGAVGTIVLAGLYGESLLGDEDTTPVPIVQPAAPATGVKAGLRYGVIPADACTPELIAELCRSRPGSELTTTCESQRRSLDGRYMIVKWRGDPPKAIAEILEAEKVWAADTAPASEDKAWAFGAVDKVTTHKAWTAEAEVAPVEVEPK
jgi:hypothetical protein